MVQRHGGGGTLIWKWRDVSDHEGQLSSMSPAYMQNFSEDRILVNFTCCSWINFAITSLALFWRSLFPSDSRNNGAMLRPLISNVSMEYLQPILAYFRGFKGDWNMRKAYHNWSHVDLASSSCRWKDTATGGVCRDWWFFQSLASAVVDQKSSFFTIYVCRWFYGWAWIIFGH